MKCACNCAACNTALEARKEDVQKHHFAHVSNYDFMHTNEMAIYQAAAAIISDLTSFCLPPIFLFLNNSRKPELLREAQNVTPDDVTFECTPKQYPPKLIISTLGSKLRLLFDFGVYYSEDDLMSFAEDGRNRNYSVLLYHFPSIEENEFFAPEHLTKIWTDSKLDRKLVRSAVEDKKREWYMSLASTPKGWGSGYECPIHIGYYRGKYSARWVDCAYCEYNLAPPPGCLCLALAGPKLPGLTDQIAERRKVNEAHIQQKRQIQTKQQSYIPCRVSPFLSTSSHTTPSSPPSQSLITEEPRMEAAFDPFSTVVLRDKYDRRWVKCTCCGEIKLAQEMSSYGGRGVECNLGICLNCSRHHRANA